MNGTKDKSSISELPLVPVPWFSSCLVRQASWLSFYVDWLLVRKEESKGHKRERHNHLTFADPFDFYESISASASLLILSWLCCHLSLCPSSLFLDDLFHLTPQTFMTGFWMSPCCPCSTLHCVYEWLLALVSTMHWPTPTKSTSVYSLQGFSTFSVYQNLMEGLLKTDC